MKVEAEARAGGEKGEAGLESEVQAVKEEVEVGPEGEVEADQEKEVVHGGEVKVDQEADIGAEVGQGRLVEVCREVGVDREAEDLVVNEETEGLEVEENIALHRVVEAMNKKSLLVQSSWKAKV